MDVSTPQLTVHGFVPSATLYECTCILQEECIGLHNKKEISECSLQAYSVDIVTMLLSLMVGSSPG